MGVLEPEDLPPDLRNVTVPDDARELDRDRLAYYRELAAKAPLAAPRFPALHRRPRPGGGSTGPAAAPRGPLFPSTPDGLLTSLAIGGATLLALFAALMATFLISGAPLQQSLPRAEVQTPVGQTGGLLPDAPIEIAGMDRSTADLRPAVLVLWPAEGCTGCEASLEDIGRASADQRIRVAVVGGPGQTEELRDAARRVGGTATYLVEPTGALSVVQPQGLTVVTVHADGVIGDVLRDVTPGTAYTDAFSSLSLPGAPESAAAR
jgi:hypothetical protein